MGYFQHIAVMRCLEQHTPLQVRIVQFHLVTEKPHFDETSGLKLEMTSNSDNAYDVANFLLLF